MLCSSNNNLIEIYVYWNTISYKSYAIVHAYKLQCIICCVYPDMLLLNKFDLDYDLINCRLTTLYITGNILVIV